MLRLLLLLLILANLLFFAWAQGLFGSLDEGREPQRLGKQLMPEKLQVTVIDPSPALPAAEPCRLLKGLTPGDLQRLMALAQEKLPGLRFALKANEAQSSVYWVFIPPQPGKLAAEKKQSELINRGVTNSTVILEEGADKFALSLGLFGSEQAADDYLRELLKRGVKSARMQMRENPLDKIQLEVRGPAEMLTKHFPEFLSGQAAAGAASIGDCPAGP